MQHTGHMASNSHCSGSVYVFDACHTSFTTPGRLASPLTHKSAAHAGCGRPSLVRRASRCAVSHCTSLFSAFRFTSPHLTHLMLFRWIIGPAAVWGGHAPRRATPSSRVSLRLAARRDSPRRAGLPRGGPRAQWERRRAAVTMAGVPRARSVLTETMRRQQTQLLDTTAAVPAVQPTTTAAPRAQAASGRPRSQLQLSPSRRAAALARGLASAAVRARRVSSR